MSAGGIPLGRSHLDEQTRKGSEEDEYGKACGDESAQAVQALCDPDLCGGWSRSTQAAAPFVTSG